MTRRRRNSRHRVHDRHDQAGRPDTLLYAPPKIVHRGITRSPRDRTAGALPITVAQAQVLAVLSDQPQGATALARACGRTPAGVTSSLYALADRNLAEKVGRAGWRRP